MKMQELEMQKLEINSCLEPYNQYIEASQSESVILKIGIDSESESCDFLFPISNIKTKWMISSLWVIKLEWNNIKIPRKYWYTKKQGELLHKIFLMCERTHAFNTNTGYENASIWFQRIVNELTVIEIEVSQGLEPTNDDGYKKAFIDIERIRIKTLKYSQNPFEKHSYAVGLNSLLEKAINLRTNSYPFHEKYWLPFTRAYSAYIKDIDEKYKLLTITKNANTDKHKQIKWELTKGKGKSYGNVDKKGHFPSLKPSTFM